MSDTAELLFDVGGERLLTIGSVVERLGILGIKLDIAANNVRGKEALISTADSPIKVLVVPTNEELVIARDTKEIVGN